MEEKEMNLERETMEMYIKEAIQYIRPVLQQDGGDIEFVELTPENVVKVRLKGHCVGCPSSQQTLQDIVARVLFDHFPFITGIQDVSDDE